MKSLNPFPLFFYQFSIPNWPDKKRQLLDLVDWQNEECWSGDHFSDYYDLEKRKAYNADFADIVKESFQSLGDQLEVSLFLSTVWAQRYFRNGLMRPHNHGGSGYSFVLYAEFDKSEHASTTFFSPFNCPIKGSNIEYTPLVAEGDILFFPSALLHMAEANKSNFVRTIFSGNIHAQF